MIDIKLNYWYWIAMFEKNLAVCKQMNIVD